MRMVARSGAKKKPLGQIISRDFKMNKYKYLMIIPVLVYLALFAYKPMYGLVIAFKNYKPTRGIERSAWVGFLWFETFFKDIYFWRLLRNTFMLSALSIIFGFPAPILLALMINEVQNTKFKRTVQTITYMPYFISLVVTCSIIKIYCQQNGLFSQIAEFFGGQRQNFMINPAAFRPIYVISGIWQNIGWNSIIYLAALSGIDQEQYEAARIDGANRFQQILHVTIPGILPTIMVLFVLRMGSILNVGYEKVLLLYTSNTYEVADVFSTYTYRMGLENQQYSLSTAVGLFNTLVNIVFLLLTNWLSRKTTESGLF
ncbi:MAG: sugar ABC transporter permease [Clostridia bacterium]|nr:sugar ABC transporter permease [Clostridia bacterium]MBO4885044.1 sugar ABC transporter permease [Clostridia bacterium]MBR4442024.1 sugar ABC transporter permease [Clostridia bacterium]